MKRQRLVLTTMIVIFIFLIPSFLIAEIRELVPCEYLFKLTPDVVKIHQHELNRIFLSDTNLQSKKPIFIMFESPAFEPESLLTVYSNDENDFFLEFLESDQNIWSQIHRQLEDADQDKEYDKKKNLGVVVKIKKNSREISEHTALTISRLLEILLNRSKVPSNDEIKNRKITYDGTTFFLYSKIGLCGFGRANNEGHSKFLLKISLLLKKYTMCDNDQLSNMDKEINQILNKFLTELGEK